MTFSESRIGSGDTSAFGVLVPPYAADSRSGSVRSATTSIFVPRGSVIGLSNQ
jgi:hypothetical protein